MDKNIVILPVGHPGLQLQIKTKLLWQQYVQQYMPHKTCDHRLQYKE